MKFETTDIPGVCVVALNRIEDERGFFARAFCETEFEEQGLVSRFVQANTSFNRLAGTLRGMHYQVAPSIETKIVRCIRGSIFDVVVDLRKDSPTYRKHFGIELTADSRTALVVPANCAHGFQTLQDDSEVFYLVSAPYTPECERGVRHDDAALSIDWPLPVSNISEKDASWPLLD